MKNYITYLGLSIIILSTCILGFYIERSDFTNLLLLFGLGTLALVAIFPDLKKLPRRNLVISAMVIKVILLFSIPNLSDDYFRFIWDGRCSVEGSNPYLSLPENCESEEIELCFDDIYDDLNSKQYYTVYPPVNQVIFAFSSWIAGDSVSINLFLLKFLIFLSELGIIFLLPKILSQLKLNPNLAWLYVFHPLVNIETIGNVHFEGMMFFFLILSVWFWQNQQKTLSTFGFALAVGTKLIPLMFLPFLIHKIGFKASMVYGLKVAFFLLLMFLPFFSFDLIGNFWSSIDLYFQNFEFNASIFYLVRGIGFWIMGYDIIQTAGPIMSLTTLIFILILALRRKWIKKDFFTTILIAFSVYLFMATTVHPWYLITLLGISVFAKFRYPVFWALLTTFSYSHYLSNGFQEHYWIIGLEYIILIVIIGLEVFQQKRNKSIV